MIGAILLIAAGLVLLLNNLGVIDWGVWQALSRLWPLLLIGIGLDLMLRKRRVASVLVAFLLVSLVVAAAAVMRHHPVELTTMQVQVPVKDARLARVRLDAGVASLLVATGVPGGAVLEGQIEHPRGAPPELKLERSGERVEVRLDQSDSDLGWLAGEGRSPDWSLRLAPDLPTDLRVEAGVGSTRLDLRGLTLSRLKVACGVGQVRVDLPGRGRYRAKIEGGVGRLELGLPRGFPVRVEVASGLGSVHVDGDFVRDGDRYTSVGFDAAEERLELDVEGGIGAIAIEPQEEAPPPAPPAPPAPPDKPALPAEAPLPPAHPAEAPLPPAPAPAPAPAPVPAQP